MEAPPNYYPPVKKTRWGLIIGLICGGIFLCCLLPAGLLVGGGLWAVNKTKDLLVCGMSYTTASKAMQDYANDHKGKLPKAETWMDDIRPYFAKRASIVNPGIKQVFGDISTNGDYSCTTAGRHTGMSFNKDLSGKVLADIKDKDTVLLFETDKVALNASEPYKAQDTKSSPQLMGSARGWFTTTVAGSTKAGAARFDEGMNGTPSITTTVEETTGKGAPKSGD